MNEVNKSFIIWKEQKHFVKILFNLLELKEQSSMWEQHWYKSLLTPQQNPLCVAEILEGLCRVFGEYQQGILMPVLFHLPTIDTEH